MHGVRHLTCFTHQHTLQTYKDAHSVHSTTSLYSVHFFYVTTLLKLIHNVRTWKRRQRSRKGRC